VGLQSARNFGLRQWHAMTPRLSQLVATRMQRILSPQLDRDAVSPASLGCPVDATELQLDYTSSVPARVLAFTMKTIPQSFRYGWLLLSALAFLTLRLPAHAQESPYFITYDHYLEEPGSLEVEYFSNLATQRGGRNFDAYWIEFEYGATAWWTTELYLDAQSTFGDSTIFTGFRLENRFRLLKSEHVVNPVLYVEYEQISEADKIMKEIEGHDVEADHAVPNAILRQGHNQELELKLLLSSTRNGWNFALNPLATKPLTGADPWEFGYAMGVSRPLALKASAKRCSFCLENFVAGVEMYGGLGDRPSLGLWQTSHYLAPVVAWNLPSSWTLRLSPGFGLNDQSHQFLLRWGVSREFSGFGSKLARWFGGQR
jgi:hypothetical protein